MPTPETIPQADIDWSRAQFNRMKIGGVWAVPRSGLLFTRIGENHLQLTDRMPFAEEMAQLAKEGMDIPATAEELRAYQEEDYACIKSRFVAAGIEVSKSENLT